ncbi:MAG: hypothetical protein WDA07_15265 [Leucobacter sp.]
MKLGDLFTRAGIESRPCRYCGAPVVDCDGLTTHFEVSENGAKTAWLECYTIGPRGRRKYSGEVAA